MSFVSNQFGGGSAAYFPMPEITDFQPIPNGLRVTGNNLQTIQQIGLELADKTILFIPSPYRTSSIIAGNNGSASYGTIDILNTPFYLPTQFVHAIYTIPTSGNSVVGSNIKESRTIQKYTNIVDSSSNAFITSDNINQYNWKQYLLNYPDLPQGWNQSQAINHGNNSGIYEGRSFPKFSNGNELINDSNKNQYDWKAYFAKYPDLQQNGLPYNQQSAINHWNDNGIYKGRTFPKY